MAKTMHISKQEATKLKIGMAVEALRHAGFKHFVKTNVYPGQTMSNKYLCGMLSVLCDTMRFCEIDYPWLAA